MKSFYVKQLIRVFGLYIGCPIEFKGRVGILEGVYTETEQEYFEIAVDFTDPPEFISFSNTDDKLSIYDCKLILKNPNAIPAIDIPIIKNLLQHVIPVERDINYAVTKNGVKFESVGFQFKEIENPTLVDIANAYTIVADTLRDMGYSLPYKGKDLIESHAAKYE